LAEESSFAILKKGYWIPARVGANRRGRPDERRAGRKSPKALRKTSR